MLKDDKASIVDQRDQRKYLEDTAIKALYHCELRDLRCRDALIADARVPAYTILHRLNSFMTWFGGRWSVLIDGTAKATDLGSDCFI